MVPALVAVGGGSVVAIVLQVIVDIVFSLRYRSGAQNGIFSSGSKACIAR